eukprot:CAMPEP_0178909974 /NCGR_PEP_ID=MMETSP0786-20121207/8837_1 /TAXON_ID=186022 /ORGANISM="Thalassionema frauenfeldii, Strain CCMP 1798" /LENGTH=326 /DNA_ID=CAMNT_0020582169 /DNA_START=26 /DNA_END=1006 /DNA_ORIENTATION=+
MPLQTILTDMLGIEHPIIQGGMQYVGYAEMASAVSNAGGLGILTALTQATPEDLRKEIRRCRTMTNMPFGVNLTILPSLIPADYDGYAKVIAEEKVALCEIAGGSPAKYVPIMHANGVTKVLHKSATLRHALKAEKSGVDLIEIVGYEASIAGGQPGDEIGLWVALTLALEKIKRVPIVASGASATGRQLAAAIAMGACGITMATRFLATREAQKSTTIVLSKLSNSTRVFKNTVSKRIREIEFDPQNDDGLSFDQVALLANGKRTKKMWQETGDYDDAMWACAQSVGLIHDIPSCQQLIERIVCDAEEQLDLANKSVFYRRRSKL